MKLFSSFLFLILCLLTSGCAKNYMERLKDDDQSLANDRLLIERHVIRIHKDGKRLHPFKNMDRTENDEYAEAQHQEIIKQLDAFLEKDSAGNQSPEKNILIYFHGGLNHENDALERAVKATQKICAPPNDSAVNDVPGNEIGATEKIPECTTTYPIFINWRSGPFTTLNDHYFRVRDGEVHENTALYTSPIYMVGDLAKTIGNIPMAWYHEGYQAIRTSVRHDNDDDKLEDDEGKYKDKDNVPLIHKTVDDEDSWNLERKARWWVTAPIKILTTPFVFTFGTPAWDNMKRRTHTMFTDQIGKNPVSLDGAARKFLKSLTEYVHKKKTNEGLKFELTLMGHSMGGIIINRALRDLPDDLKEVDNLVYMASADNLQNYLDATLPLVKKKDSLRIYNLHLHPENENREISSGGLAPSGSLLVWIDHTYDTPEYILQRTSGRWSNIRLVLDFIRKTESNKDLLENYRFTVFGRGPDKKSPQLHGSFDDFNFWEESYWTGKKICWIGDKENNCSKESKWGITACGWEFFEHKDTQKHDECLTDVKTKYNTCMDEFKSGYDKCMNLMRGSTVGH